jgi:hypothetical protein
MIPIRKLHAEAMNKNAPVQSMDRAFAFKLKAGRSMLSFTTREVMINANAQKGKLI